MVAGGAVPTLAGITFAPDGDDSWVCFTEAKWASDCAHSVTHDPHRNQIARVIENLMCFQGSGQHPATICFTLLTPRTSKDRPTSRLYGYKMREYTDTRAVLDDVGSCTFDMRADRGYHYPELAKRVEALQPVRWTTFEEVFQDCGLLPPDADLFNDAEARTELRDEISSRLAALAQRGLASSQG